MATVTAKDGAKIFYKDWGEGQPVVFSHGWPLSADAWDAQMLFLGQRGYRVVAHDRQGHGRSEQTWTGNDMDTYADDLACLIDTLDLRDVVLVGHSTGGGEVTRYIGRHGTERVSRVVLLSAVPPRLLRSQENPDGVSPEVFDELRENVRRNRAQFFQEMAVPFYGYNREGAEASLGVLHSFWYQAMQAGIVSVYDCIAAFSETDFTSDLECFDVPTLIIHGDDDQVVPLEASALRTVQLVENAILKVYPGAPHGLATTHQDAFNEDLLEFIQTGTVREATEQPAVH